MERVVVIVVMLNLHPALYGTDRDGPGAYDQVDTEGGDAFFLEMIVPALVTASVLLSPEAVEAVPGSATRRWVEANQQFGKDLDASGLAAEGKRRVADVLLFQDIAREVEEEVHAAGLTGLVSGQPPRQMDERAFWKPPFIGLYREVLHERHVNQQPGRGVRWKPGDLWDMTYLGCAAAYADVVMCERSATHYLTQAIERRPDGAKVFKNLPQAVEHIQRLLA